MRMAYRMSLCYSSSAASYLAQMLRAADDERRAREELLAQGFVQVGPDEFLSPSLAAKEKTDAANS